jgi:hypothetical protein
VKWPLVLHHGTTVDRLPGVLKRGIKVGEGWAGASTEGVYLSRHDDSALMWAKTRLMRDLGWDKIEESRFDRILGEDGLRVLVVLEVHVPKEAEGLLRADMEQAEDFQFEGEAEDWERAYDEMGGELMLNGPVPPEWIVGPLWIRDQAEVRARIRGLAKLRKRDDDRRAEREIPRFNSPGGVEGDTCPDCQDLREFGPEAIVCERHRTCPDCERLEDGLWRTGRCDECRGSGRDEHDEGCANCLGTGSPVCCRCEGTGVDLEANRGRLRRTGEPEASMRDRRTNSEDDRDTKAELLAIEIAPEIADLLLANPSTANLPLSEGYAALLLAEALLRGEDVEKFHTIELPGGRAVKITPEVLAAAAEVAKERFGSPPEPKTKKKAARKKAATRKKKETPRSNSSDDDDSLQRQVGFWSDFENAARQAGIRATVLTSEREIYVESWGSLKNIDTEAFTGSFNGKKLKFHDGADAWAKVTSEISKIQKLMRPARKFHEVLAPVIRTVAGRRDVGASSIKEVYKELASGGRYPLWLFLNELRQLRDSGIVDKSGLTVFFLPATHATDTYPVWFSNDKGFRRIGYLELIWSRSSTERGSTGNSASEQ